MTRFAPTHPWSVTRRLFVVGLATAGLVLSGCSTGPNAINPGQPGQSQQRGTDGSTPPAPAASPDPVAMVAAPANGTKNVEVDTLVGVSATNGTLTKVTVSGPVKDRSGQVTTVAVKGALNPAKTAWKAADRLEPGVVYTVTSTGTNPEGTATKTTSRFTTQNLTLDEQTFTTVSPLSGTYGVAMPIVLTFDVPVTDRKAFEQHLSVTASPKQEGSWSWYSATEVHYRPKAYWRPGTKIAMTADLNSVAAGKGIYGQESRTADYTIGRSVVTKVDLDSKRAQVKVDGKVARTIKVSGGKAGFITRSGTKVINEKLRVTQMRSETVGINNNDPEAYDLKVKWAMRITNSGEFLHAAPWNSANMGIRNASHGCIGMNTADAAWMFDIVNVGDPVEVVGTDRGLEKGNGWTDWDVSYAEFAQGSAL